MSLLAVCVRVRNSDLHLHLSSIFTRVFVSLVCDETLTLPRCLGAVAGRILQDNQALLGLGIGL
jgi:hypothetical protein